MTRVPLADKIRREVDEEADNILGEMSRLMSPALRARAEQVAELARVLKFPIPAPIAWMLDLQDATTREAGAKEYPPGSEGYLMRVADERHITVDEARRELLDQLRELEGDAPLRGRAAREAEAAAAEPEIDVPVVRKSAATEVVAPAEKDGPRTLTEQEAQHAEREAAEKPDLPLDVTPSASVKPPPASVSVRTSTTPRQGAPARPALDVEHVTVRPRSELGQARPATVTSAKKPAAKKPAGSTRIYTREDGTTRHVPTHPGIEAVPEHLRHVPAGQSGGPIKQRIATAEFQKAILDDVLGHPNSISNEVAERLGRWDDRALISKHMGALADAGLIQRTGVNRYAHGKPKHGKAGKEFSPPTGAETPSSGHPPAEAPVATAAAPASSAKRRPTPSRGSEPSTRGSSPSQSATAASGQTALQSSSDAAPGRTASEDERELNAAAATSGSDLSGAELLTLYRDYAVAQKGKGPFTATKAADALGTPVIAAELMLSLLSESARGAVVIDAGVPGLKAYEYNEMRPGKAGMGAAALRDHETAKARGESSNGNGGGDPVAGTGRHWIDDFSGTPAVKRLVRMAEKKWPGSASKRGSGHIMIKPPNHGPVTIGANSKGNALRKDQTLLERAGLIGAVA